MVVVSRSGAAVKMTVVRVLVLGSGAREHTLFWKLSLIHI